MAKNAIGRALRQILDPEPSDALKNRLWEFFGGKCAYCDAPVAKDKREGRMDHLVSESAGGPNHITNRVLACGQCNDNEKRQRDWEEFLRERIPDALVREARRAKIIEWQMVVSGGRLAPRMDVQLRTVVESEVAKAISSLETAAENLRSLRIQIQRAVQRKATTKNAVVKS